MKILVISHTTNVDSERGVKGNWHWLTYYFKKLGHDVRVIVKQEWLNYFFIVRKFKPDVIVSVGKIAGLITSFHHIFKFGKKPLFVFDLTDHPYFYKSDSRIKFILKNHDIVTTSSYYSFVKYKCDYLIPNGSNFKPLIDRKIKWDACYVGQTNMFYRIDKLKKDCSDNGINLKVVDNSPTSEVPNFISKSKVCVFPISWDSSIKTVDYAAMGKAVVALKPNLLEKIGYPAYYTTDLAEGISYLLKNTKLTNKLGKLARSWYLDYTGTWENQAKKYLSVFKKNLN